MTEADIREIIRDELLNNPELIKAMLQKMRDGTGSFEDIAIWQDINLITQSATDVVAPLPSE